MVKIKYRLHDKEEKLAFLTATTPVWTRRWKLQAMFLPLCVFLNYRKQSCLLQLINQNSLFWSFITDIIQCSKSIYYWYLYSKTVECVCVVAHVFVDHSGVKTDIINSGLMEEGCQKCRLRLPTGNWTGIHQADPVWQLAYLPSTVCRRGLPRGIMAEEKKGWTRGNREKNARNEGWAQPSRSVQRQHVQWTLSGTSSSLRTHICACLWAKNLRLINL